MLMVPVLLRCSFGVPTPPAFPPHLIAPASPSRVCCRLVALLLRPCLRSLSLFCCCLSFAGIPDYHPSLISGFLSIPSIASRRRTSHPFVWQPFSLISTTYAPPTFLTPLLLLSLCSVPRHSASIARYTVAYHARHPSLCLFYAVEATRPVNQTCVAVLSST